MSTHNSIWLMVLDNLISDCAHFVHAVTLNKGHNTFDLSVKDKFCSPYNTMAMQSYLLNRTISV